MIRRFGTIILLAAIAFVTSSCHKGFCPDLSDKLLIEFAPGAENATTKAASAPDAGFDFGVWGIARYKTSNVPDYLLWDATSMTEVKQVQAGNSLSYSYIPVTDAFWFRDYTYDFIAVAPWAAADGLTVTSGESSGSDILTFDFDLAEKYSPTQPTDPDAAPVAPDYDFDLMAAVGHSFVETTATHPTQDLTFWHLLSKIQVKVGFGNDLSGKKIDGKVTKIRLGKVQTKAEYTVSASSPNQLSIDFKPYSEPEVSIEYQVPENMQAPDPNRPNWVLHIIPQVVKNMELYLDFAINEGTTQEPDWVEYKNLWINLDLPANQVAYGRNEQYNWNITIGTKAAITFSVDVTDWTEAEEFEIPM